MLTKPEQQQLLSLLQNPAWPVIEKIANNLCDLIKYEETVSSDQWETMRDTLLNAGQVRGIKRLLKNLYNYASND